MAVASRVLPWDIHPALTEDRLRFCARLLANARRDAVRMASPEMGDDSWSVGCRAYAFGKQRLQRTADARTCNWLAVLDGSHHFVFLIQDVPVRFFRGGADEPTTRTLRRQVIEAEQLSLALGAERAQGLVFRLALEKKVRSSACGRCRSASRPGRRFAPTQMTLLGEDAEMRLLRAPGGRKAKGVTRPT